MTQQLAIKEGLFTWPAETPELLGSRCKHCGEAAFPAQDDCRACGKRDTEITTLGSRGTLWTWTIQSFMPKSPYLSDETPETFKPYGVGYVEMPGGVRVESRLQLNEGQTPYIGMLLDLDIQAFRTNDSGQQIMLFSFKAAEE